jgi:hypothetical protein
MYEKRRGGGACAACLVYQRRRQDFNHGFREGTDVSTDGGACGALPPFPKMAAAASYVEVLDGFVRRFQAASILPESETAELFGLYAQVANVYPRGGTDMVSSHNDLKPENILFDGDRAWLVDWEASFLNDRYVDLAVVANFIVTTDAEEEVYLRSYFGEEAGDYRMAQFYLMRQVTHVFYAVVFLLIGSAGKPIEANAEMPDFRDFHDAIWAGDVSLAGNESKLSYGRIHLRRALENMRTAWFREAVKLTRLAPRLV